MKMSSSTQQVLTHRNPTHASDSFLRLSKLRREGILCDLTILVQGHKFKAHKAVMAACSDYFLTAICGGKSTASVSVSNGTSGSHMTIELQYVTMRGFAPLLEYAYTSDLNVNASDVIDVLTAASYMQMFDVANACSEFMRSNLLWTQNQTRLAGLPLIPGQRPFLLNGHNEDRGTASPVYGRTNGLPEAVSNLLQATSAISGNAATTGSPGLGRPPMLIPISSINPYEVNLQQIADTMAAATGTRNLISRLVNGHSNATISSSPSSVSPVASSQSSPSTNWTAEKRPASLQPPSAPDRPNSSEIARSEGASPRSKDAVSPLPREQEKSNTSKANSNSNNNNNSSSDSETNGGGSSRKSVAVKVETTSGDEMNTSVHETTTKRRPESPQGDSEDSWQSLQRLYSFGKADSNSISPGKSPLSTTMEINSAALQQSTLSPSLLSRIATTNGMKMALDKYKDSLPKLESGLPIVPNLNGLPVTMHRALLQQQLLAQQQQQQLQQNKTQSRSDSEKMVPELPAVPPGGQYMSVRRRTLQSNVPKPHQCQICGSRFTRFHNLKQHIKLHSGIKPYECDECGKRFTRNYTLRLHKMKHVGLRNFRCGTCDAAFTSLGEFRAHLRITLHSHIPVTSAEGSPQAQNRMLEPEDLSNGQVRGMPVKFEGQFDCSMLNYGVGSPGSSEERIGREGSTGTLTPPENSNERRMMPGMDSPRLSDRSFSGSPQDLTTKRPLSEDDEELQELNKRPRSADSSSYRSLADKETSEPLSLVMDQGVVAEGSN